MHMHHHQSPVDAPCACSVLRKASRAVSRVYDGELAAVGMTVSQFTILRAIRRTGGQPLSRLADEMVMDRTSLYRALTPLVRAGWVVIAVGASGRTKLVSMSKAGRRIMTTADGHWRTAQKRFVEAFGVARWSGLEKSITRAAEIGVAVGP